MVALIFCSCSCLALPSNNYRDTSGIRLTKNTAGRMILWSGSKTISYHFFCCRVETPDNKAK